MKNLALIFLLFTSSAFAAAAKYPEVGFIEADREFEGGSGCSVWSENQKFVFADEASDSTAVMRIDGNRLVGQLQKSSKAMSAHGKKGEQFTSVYDFKDYKVAIKGKVTETCPPGSESCEVTNYKVDLTVTHGKLSKTLHDLDGDCGS